MKAQRGHDHLVTRADAERGQRERQRGGAVGHRDAVVEAEVPGPVLLQGGHRIDAVGIGHEPGAVERVEDGLAVLVLDQRPVDAAPILRHGRGAPERCQLAHHSPLDMSRSAWSGWPRPRRRPPPRTCRAARWRGGRRRPRPPGVIEPVCAGDAQPRPRVGDRLDRPARPGERRFRPIPGRSGAAVRRAARPAPACPSRTGRARAARRRPRRAAADEFPANASNPARPVRVEISTSVRNQPPSSSGVSGAGGASRARRPGSAGPIRESLKNASCTSVRFADPPAAQERLDGDRAAERGRHRVGDVHQAADLVEAVDHHEVGGGARRRRRAGTAGGSCPPRR